MKPFSIQQSSTSCATVWTWVVQRSLTNFWIIGVEIMKIMKIYQSLWILISSHLLFWNLFSLNKFGPVFIAEIITSTMVYNTYSLLYLFRSLITVQHIFMTKFGLHRGNIQPLLLCQLFFHETLHRSRNSLSTTLYFLLTFSCLLFFSWLQTTIFNLVLFFISFRNFWSGGERKIINGAK